MLWNQESKSRLQADVPPLFFVGGRGHRAFLLLLEEQGQGRVSGLLTTHQKTPSMHLQLVLQSEACRPFLDV